MVSICSALGRRTVMPLVTFEGVKTWFDRINSARWLGYSRMKAVSQTRLLKTTTIGAWSMCWPTAISVLGSTGGDHLSLDRLRVVLDGRLDNRLRQGLRLHGRLGCGLRGLLGLAVLVVCFLVVLRVAICFLLRLVV